MKGAIRVLETRSRADGLRARRYLMPDGSRLVTWEIPAAVIKGVGLQRVRDAMAAWLRGQKNRASSSVRLHRIEELLGQGVKPTAIAHEVGVSDSYVCQVRRAMKK